MSTVAAPDVHALIAPMLAPYPALELHEEEPVGFGAGHVVLYAGARARFAITEQCDRPADDPDRDVIGWEWCVESRGAGKGWRTMSTGVATTSQLPELLEAVSAWIAAGHG